LRQANGVVCELARAILLKVNSKLFDDISSCIYDLLANEMH